MQKEAVELFRQVLDDEIAPQQFAAGFQALITDNLDKILDAINLVSRLRSSVFSIGNIILGRMPCS